MHLTIKQLEYLDSLLRALYNAKHYGDPEDIKAAEQELNKFGITIDYDDSTP